MNIYHFENEINPIIYDRGYDYYLAGHIKESVNLGEREYLFTIEGTNEYEVFVKLDRHGNILDSFCDCPYDKGPVCKHEVAAYFQLLGIVQEDSNYQANKPTTFHDVLNALTKEQLIEIIIDFTKDDETLEERLMFTYGKRDQEHELEYCRRLIRSIEDKYSGRDGFIHYDDVFDFANELEEVLEKAEDMDDLLVSTDIALLVLRAAVEAISYADDSSGAIGFVTDRAILILDEISKISVENNDDKRAIFKKILTAVDEEDYEFWSDFQYDLLAVSMNFADDENMRLTLMNKVETLIEQTDDRYLIKSLRSLMLEVKEKYESKEEAEKFLHEHIHYHSFRKKAIQQYLRDKEYEKVIALAKDGEEKDAQHPGLVLSWKTYRYEALKGLELKEEQQLLARELFFAGDVDFYEELKKLTDDEEKLYEELKQKLKDLNTWRARDLLLELIEKENDLVELLQYVKEHPYHIEKYSEKLAEFFKDDVIEIYERFIKTIAANSSNRKEYRNVCQTIKKFSKIGGERKKTELVETLKALYKRRPAFLDELGKI